MNLPTLMPPRSPPMNTTTLSYVCTLIKRLKEEDFILPQVVPIAQTDRSVTPHNIIDTLADGEMNAGNDRPMHQHNGYISDNDDEDAVIDENDINAVHDGIDNNDNDGTDNDNDKDGIDVIDNNDGNDTINDGINNNFSWHRSNDNGDNNTVNNEIDIANTDNNITSIHKHVDKDVHLYERKHDVEKINIKREWITSIIEQEWNTDHNIDDDDKLDNNAVVDDDDKLDNNTVLIGSNNNLHNNDNETVNDETVININEIIGNSFVMDSRKLVYNNDHLETKHVKLEFEGDVIDRNDIVDDINNTDNQNDNKEGIDADNTYYDIVTTDDDDTNSRGAILHN